MAADEGHLHWAVNMCWPHGYNWQTLPRKLHKALLTDLSNLTLKYQRLAQLIAS